MKKRLAIIILFAAGICACVPPEERGNKDVRTEETRRLSSFSNISVSESINVIMQEGTENSARIETSEIDTEEVLLEVSGSYLEIHMADSKFNFWSRKNWSKNVKVYLTYNGELESVKASSSSSVTGKSPIDTDRMYVEVSSSARVDLSIDSDEIEVHVSSSGKGQLETDTDDLEARVSSSGSLLLSGRADYQRFKVSSSGKYESYDLNSRKADGGVSSSGRAEITVSDELTGDASSSGRITYRGNPGRVIVDTSSSGKIRRAD